jgi:dolichol-phosphate mannosyltransferase
MSRHVSRKAGYSVPSLMTNLRVSYSSWRIPSSWVAKSEECFRFLRFGIVGATGVILNSTILFLLVQTAGWNRLLAAAVATETSILSNFALNDCWTFSNRKAINGRFQRAIRYNAVALTGLAVSLAVMAALMRLFALQYLIANLFGIIAGMSLNYLGSLRIAWSRGPSLAV